MRLAQYQLLDRLNHDGWAQLYRARDPEGREVVVHDPSLRPGVLDDPADAASLAAYLRELARLDHPNIERITEVGTDKLWFAAEYFPYPLSLDRCIRDKEAPCSRAERVRVVLDVLAGLGYAHQRGIVHTAVNPVNVFVLDQGPAKLVNLIEGWHTARSLRRGTLAGATHFMAPEFILDGKITPAMDLFACGVLLYRLLLGSYPFHGKDGPSTIQAILHDAPGPVAERCEQCSAQFGAILDRALQKDPGQRYATAADFARDLSAVSVGQ